jgi:hypothetical protein
MLMEVTAPRDHLIVYGGRAAVEFLVNRWRCGRRLRAHVERGQQQCDRGTRDEDTQA